jgi:hypothetical protein
MSAVKRMGVVILLLAISQFGGYCQETEQVVYIPLVTMTGPREVRIWNPERWASYGPSLPINAEILTPNKIQRVTARVESLEIDLQEVESCWKGFCYPRWRGILCLLGLEGGEKVITVTLIEEDGTSLQAATNFYYVAPP